MMMTPEEKAKLWLESPAVDAADKQSIEALKKDPDAFEDAFYKDLEFGTGGLRGVMGVGTNRMNRYTVGMATQGLANYINKADGPKKVAIAYDSRHNSRNFADQAADILGANGIDVHMFEDLRPTPLLSFAIRQLGCQSGIVITASHNPKEYNGYKVYWSDGGQVIPPHDKAIIEEVRLIDRPDKIQLGANPKHIHRIGEEMDEAFLKMIATLRVNPKPSPTLKIVFSSIHGTGITLVPPVLESFGYSASVVKAQAEPNGDFPTVSYPNPEEAAALKLALEQADHEDADIVMATDPDTDRVGIAIRNENNEMELMNGNQTGALLIHYLLENINLEKISHPFVAKTIVTTELISEIAKHFGVTCYDTLTGFKYIAALIREKEESETYLVGGEESYGYMIGDKVRDKDGVAACALLADMAAASGNRPFDRLMTIYETFGCYRESLLSITKKGRQGANLIQSTLTSLRETPPKIIGGIEVAAFLDYQSNQRLDTSTGTTSAIGLPTANVLQFLMVDGSKISVRPSGTEPKIKFYFSAKAELSSRVNYRKIVADLEQQIKLFERDIAASLL